MSGTRETGGTCERGERGVALVARVPLVSLFALGWEFRA